MVFGLSKGWGLVARGAAFAAALLALNAVNAGIDRRTPVRFNAEFAQSEGLRVEANGGGVDIRLSRVIHQFSKVGADGNTEFNPWALLYPAAVSISTGEEAQTYTATVPFEWAPDFEKTEIVDPTHTREIEDMIINQIAEQIRSQVVMRGWPQSNSYKTWNAQGGNYTLDSDGNLVPPIGQGLSISSVVITGEASDEAQPGKPESLGAANPENEALARRRAEHYEERFKNALSRAGFDMSGLEGFRIQGLENLLNGTDITKVQQIAEKAGMPVMDLIHIHNINNLNISPEDQDFLRRAFDDHRNVTAEIITKGERGNTTTIQTGFPLPLLLMFLLVGRPGRKVPYVNRYIHDVRVKEYERVVARRLYAEYDPEDYGEPRDTERSFLKTYASVDLNAGDRGHLYVDLQMKQRHMLLEEVRDSLDADPKKREPFLDYVGLMNRALAHMHANSTPDSLFRNIDHATDEDAQSFITKELANMWEVHDRVLFPMRKRNPETGECIQKLNPTTGELEYELLDLNKQLHYRYRDDVVRDAKLVAEQFVHTLRALYRKNKQAIDQALQDDTLLQAVLEGKAPQPIVTTDEIRAALDERINFNAAAAELDGYSVRNIPVPRSADPTGEEYKAALRN